MKIISVVLCMGVFFLINVADLCAAPKTKTARKTENKSADNMQCNEMTLIGVIEERQKEIKEGDKVRIDKFYALVDTKKKEWTIHPWNVSAKGIEKVKAVLGAKVKLVGMVVGSSTSLVSIKSVDKM